jgi:hypothetical protein
LGPHETPIGAAESWLLAFAGGVFGIENVKATTDKPIWPTSQANDRISIFSEI